MINIFKTVSDNIIREYTDMKLHIEKLNKEIKEKTKIIYSLNKEKNNICKINKIINEDRVFLRLSDICRTTKDIFNFDENKIKQYMFQENLLTKNNSKYIPTDRSKTVCKLVDNELYISEDYFRGVLVFLRSCVYLDDNLINLVKRYTKNCNETREKIANTVSIECKQNSKEFSKCKENKFYLK